tara:strand:+ start:433 stop:1158 length:726 start_codon:yes stop_codon:yes gene_type:complete
MRKEKQPRFAVIKAFLSNKVESGEWTVGLRIPTEQALADMFSVSRMTARRAVKELTDEGLFTRTPGLGTFVSSITSSAAALTILDVVAMAQSTGSYSYRLLAIDRVEANTKTAAMMQLTHRANIFQLTLVHLDNNQPIQWQGIAVNAKLAPALMKQKLDKVVPDTYLNWIAPPTSVQYQVKAVVPRASQIRELGLSEETDPVCLQLTRKNWLGPDVVSVSRMLHPAHNYSLGVDLELNNQR